MSGQSGVGAGNAYQQLAMSGTPQGQGSDLKNPLAKFALNMAMQQMTPKQGLKMGAPQHVMGLKPGQIKNPYGG